MLGLTWGVWDAPVFTLCPDIILGADVLYETSGRIICVTSLHFVALFGLFFTYQLTGSILSCMHCEAFDDLFATVTFLLQNSPSSVFITAYHNRRYLQMFMSSFLCSKQCATLGVCTIMCIFIWILFCRCQYFLSLLFSNINSGHHLLEFLMVKWGLKCVNLIDGFSFMPADKASGLSGNIQLVEIILDDDKLS